MIDSVIGKIEDNPNCELTKEEVKLLYGINCDIKIDIRNYLFMRDKYLDLKKVFNESQIATTKEEITENTICYIGDLVIDSKLPIYNLRYIYGSLQYKLNDIINLENLEIVAGYLNINNSNNYDELCNLKYVSSLKISNINNISSLNYFIKSLDLITILDLKFTSENIVNNLDISDNIKILVLENIESIKEVSLPNSLIELQLLSSYHSFTVKETVLKVNNLSNLQELKVGASVNISRLQLPSNLKKIHLSSLLSIENSILPDKLKVYNNYLPVDEKLLKGYATRVSDYEKVKSISKNN